MCYDHLAGELGVMAFEALLARRLFEFDANGLRITEHGLQWFTAFGVDVAAVISRRRMMCRTCLDWSERRQHLAGAWGAALLQRLFQLGWARQAKGTRIVQFTPTGERAFQAAFALPEPAARADTTARATG